MRLLKAQNTNLRNIYGKGVKYDVNDQVVVDSERAMVIPTGPTTERPGEAGVPTSSANGQVRYNTTDNQFEVYQNNGWRAVRFKEPNQDPGIVQQNLGSGDAVEIRFGLLDSQDSNFPIPDAAQNVIVLVENVFQISTTNYSLEQNPASPVAITSIVSTGATTVVETDSNHGYDQTNDKLFISGVDSTLDDACENLNTAGSVFDIVSIPSANQLEIDVDTSTGNPATYVPSSGTISRGSTLTNAAFPDGWYIKFTSPVDLGKPVTVLHNFDK